MRDKGSGGSQGPFQGTPIFGRKCFKLPDLPKVHGLKLPAGKPS